MPRAEVAVVLPSAVVGECLVAENLVAAYQVATYLVEEQIVVAAEEAEQLFVTALLDCLAAFEIAAEVVLEAVPVDR